ncbi:hypothetical protein [Lysinibacillus xylanilyticus]|uniref:hypothetical protein n=1 Tax=Lysinibacillus xylanilyticus TaxID=582475 RepID=UPI003D092E3A
MKRFLTIIISFGLLVILSIPVSAQKFDYPSNKEKTFINEDEFYQQLKKDEYKEYDNASYSIRRKISYKEVPDAVMTFEKKTGRYMCQPKQDLSLTIHPERQVYFFASFVQTQNEEYWKHTIIDAETKQQLEGGNSYHLYDNPYK